MPAYESKQSNLEVGTVTNFVSTLNHAGDSVENPIIAGFAQRIRFSKHNEDETFRHAWITASDGRQRFLDSIAAVSAEDIVIDVVHGTHTFSGDPPVRNRLNITTTNGHKYVDFYVATAPTHKVLLNGYDASNASQPYIWPWH